MGDVDALQVAWFNRFLKDVDNGVDRGPRVKLFDLVAKCWRDFDERPQSARAFYTSSDGLAGSTESGRLSERPAARAVSDVIGHDPWRPVPAVGGHNAELAGRFGMSGGGPVPRTLKKAWRDELNLPLIESYGQSELGGFGGLGFPVLEPDRRLGTIGPALPDKEVCIFNREGREVPIGQVGQICLRGDS
jgi:acyl-CoA synthetase (AMP-forming)/AMP-acid ligase II